MAEMAQDRDVTRRDNTPAALPPVNYKDSILEFIAKGFGGIKSEALSLANGNDTMLAEGVRIDKPEMLDRIRHLVGAGTDSGTFAHVSRNPVTPGPDGKLSETWTIRLMNEAGDKFGKFQFDAATGTVNHLNIAASYAGTNRVEAALEPVIKEHGAAIAAFLKNPGAGLAPAVMTDLKTAFGLAESDELTVRKGNALSFGRTGGLAETAYRFEVHATQNGETSRLASVAVEQDNDRPIVTLSGRDAVRPVAP